MQLGTFLLGERLVGGVADQVVAELEAILASCIRTVRAQQVAAHQRGKVAAEPGTLLLGGEGGHRCPREALADHAGLLQHGPLAGRELLQAGGQQHLDRRRDADATQLGAGQPATTIAAE